MEFTISSTGPADMDYELNRIALIPALARALSRRMAMYYHELTLLPFLKNLYFLLLTVALGANVFPNI